MTRTSHAEALCSSEPPTKLTVEWFYAEVKFSDEKTLAELQVIAVAWGIPTSERQAHPLLVVSSNVNEGAVIVEAGAKQFGPGKFCPSPRTVIFRIHFTDRWIAHEALADLHGSECVARMLREHGEKIILAENELLTDFSNTFADRFRPDFALLQEMPGTNATEAESQFESGARKLVDSATLPLIAKRNEVVATTINSAEQLDRLTDGVRGCGRSRGGGSCPVALARAKSTPNDAGPAGELARMPHAGR